MVSPKFYCDCTWETTNQNEVADHLEANKSHLIRVRYQWVEE